jgi:beta-galactosidase GanA
VRIIGTTAAALALAMLAPAAAQETPVPRIASKDGRHALIVDGAPFLMLAAQVNNSSAWPAAMPRVWPTMEALNVNTVEVPIAWEQIERKEGVFDFSYLDLLLAQARERDMRLVLLWFGTWKNTNPQYTPAWVKLNNTRFPRMRAADGTNHYALSPFGRETLAADRRAFAAFIRHLKQVDPQNTVVMVQVQNEPGSYGLPRDHSPTANAAFAGPVPSALLRQMKKQPGNWSTVFGRDAELYFHAWHVARYIDQVAAAGKAVKPIPMYVNAALPGDPFKYQEPKSYASGGPANTVIDVYKAAAPHLDVLAPDIYNPDYKAYLGFLDAYDRPDNPLLVPETGHAKEYARYFFEAMGRGAIGWAPFGVDGNRYRTALPLAPRLDAEAIAPFAVNFALFRPIARLWARLAFDGKTWGAARPGHEAGPIRCNRQLRPFGFRHGAAHGQCRAVRRRRDRRTGAGRISRHRVSHARGLRAGGSDERQSDLRPDRGRPLRQGRSLGVRTRVER